MVDISGFSDREINSQIERHGISGQYRSRSETPGFVVGVGQVLQVEPKSPVLQLITETGVENQRWVYGKAIVGRNELATQVLASDTDTEPTTEFFD